jgi:hypothetical protein
MIDFYALQFLGGDKETARKIIDVKQEVAKQDIGLILFVIGATAICIPMTFFLVFTEDPGVYVQDYLIASNITNSTIPDIEDPIGEWVNIEYTFRFFFFITLIVLGAAAATSILKRVKINYVYIFEINIR